MVRDPRLGQSVDKQRFKITVGVGRCDRKVRKYFSFMPRIRMEIGDLQSWIASVFGFADVALADLVLANVAFVRGGFFEDGRTVN